MTTLLELAALVVTIVAIFGTLAIIHLWLGAMAQWLWLLTIRGPLVAAVSFAVLVATLVALQLLTGLDMMTSLGFLIGLVAMVLHKGFADVSVVWQQHSGAEFWKALGRYLLRNLAG